MKILFWTGNFWPHIGGTATFATKVLPVLKQRGYEILVVASERCSTLSPQESFKGIPVRRFPFWDPNTYTMIERLAMTKKNVGLLKREFSPDLIHLSSMNMGHFFHLETKETHPAPVVVTVHGYNDSKEVTLKNLSSLEEKVLKSANWVTGVSHNLMGKFRKVMPDIIPRSTVIHNGLDLPHVPPTPLPFKPPILLYLGRLVKEKGIDVALSAFSKILARFPQTRMVIAGDGPEGSSLARQAQSLGIQDSVDFRGWVLPGDVSDLINSASVIVIPSRWEEPFGFVALEASLMARPVVATRVGGLSEIIVHSKTGLLVNKEDSQELAGAVYDLLNNPAMAEQMGLAARQNIMEKFSLRQCVDAYDSLYQKIGNKPIQNSFQSLFTVQKPIQERIS